MKKPPGNKSRRFCLRRYEIYANELLVTAIAVTTTTAAIAAGALFAGASDIDFDGAAVHGLLIEHRDRLLGLSLGAHLDKSEALGASGLTVGDHRNRIHSASFSEHSAQSIFGGVIRQVSNIQFVFHDP